jgi:hypothetical protein
MPAKQGIYETKIINNWKKYILRRMSGPTKDRGGTWRIKINDELINLIRNNIISYIKAQKLSWFGRVHRMTNDGMVKKLNEWKSISTGLQEDQKLGGKTMWKKLQELWK